VKPPLPPDTLPRASKHQVRCRSSAARRPARLALHKPDAATLRAAIESVLGNSAFPDAARPPSKLEANLLPYGDPEASFEVTGAPSTTFMIHEAVELLSTYVARRSQPTTP
jgi:hypothetical protein